MATDVCVPISRLAECVVATQRDLAEAGLVAPIVGHVGDGNVHVNVTGVDPDDESVDDAVFRLATSMGGNISAEHGIGIAKRRWLSLNRSAAEMETFRSIKRSLDPVGILNPNVLL